MNKKYSKYALIGLCLLCAFFLGRAFGFNEAEKAYQPVIDKSYELIQDLQNQVQTLKDMLLHDSETTKDYEASA